MVWTLRFKSTLRSVHLTVFLVAENLKIYKILHYVLKLRLICLNNNLFLSGGGVGTWRSLYELLSEHPRTNYQDSFFICTLFLVLLTFSIYSPRVTWRPSDLTPVLLATPVCTPNYHLDISTWGTERRPASASPLSSSPSSHLLSSPSQ